MSTANVSTGVTRYRPALDGLRAYAVVAVVLFHAGATSNLPGLAPGGFLGVSVFFTLSGYLVTTLLIRRSEQPDGFDVARFWARRIRRLGPMAVTVVLATVVASPVFGPWMTVDEAAAGLLGYKNWSVILQGSDDLLRTIVGPLGPFWSLAIEEQFYVLLTIVVLLAYRTRRPLRTLAIVFGAGWTGSLLVQVLVSGPQYRLEFGTDSRGAELLAGCGLALLLHHRPDFPARHARSLVWAGPVAFAVLVTLAATTDYDPPWLLRGGYAAVSLVSAVIVTSLLAPGPLTRLMSDRSTVAIGRLSYSWYVVHWPIILIVSAERTGLDRWALVAAKVGVGLVVAVVGHVCVEQPIRALGPSARRTAAVWLASVVFVLTAATLIL